MTWCADEIILLATPMALRLVSASPQWAPFSYVVRSLDSHEWHTREVQHTLPAEGLIFIRPVGSVSSGDLDWYGAPMLDWTAISGELGAAAQLDRQVTEQLSSYLHDDLLPPPAFRTAMASLAMTLQQVVIYYRCFMWGGDVESEYCLVYKPTESLFITKSSLPPDNPGVEDALRAGLSQLGLELPTGYFAPHVSSFPWQAHKL